MSGAARTASSSRPTRRALSLPVILPAQRAPALVAAALLALGACGGRDVADDAPAPPSTGIPAAAPNAIGAPIGAVDPPLSPAAPEPRAPEELQLPPDPFGVPDISPEPSPSGSGKPSGIPL